MVAVHTVAVSFCFEDDALLALLSMHVDYCMEYHSVEAKGKFLSVLAYIAYVVSTCELDEAQRDQRENCGAWGEFHQCVCYCNLFPLTYQVSLTSSVIPESPSAGKLDHTERKKC